MIKRIFLLTFLLIIFSCGNGDTAQEGVGNSNNIITHGHAGVFDGGILNHAGTALYNNTANPIALNNNSVAWTFTNEYYDELYTHSTITNSHYIIVPTGYNYVKVDCNFSVIYTYSATVNYLLNIYLYNDSNIVNWQSYILPATYNNVSYSFNSTLIPLIPISTLYLLIESNAPTTSFYSAGDSYLKQGCSFNFMK